MESDFQLPNAPKVTILESRRTSSAKKKLDVTIKYGIT